MSPQARSAPLARRLQAAKAEPTKPAALALNPDRKPVAKPEPAPPPGPKPASPPVVVRVRPPLAASEPPGPVLAPPAQPPAPVLGQAAGAPALDREFHRLEQLAEHLSGSLDPGVQLSGCLTALDADLLLPGAAIWIGVKQLIV